MADPAYRNKVALVGHGVTKAVRRADRPVGALAVEASLDALSDAGITPDMVDGVACGASLPTWGGAQSVRSGVDVVDTGFLARHLRLETRWTLDVGNFPPALAHAAAAVASGAATYVLVNRTLHNPASGYNRFAERTAGGQLQWSAPYGNSAPVIGFALVYNEYQQRYGARREHMAPVVTELRRNVQRIPDAYWYGTELTVEEYMASRLVSDPMCILDNDIPVDGSGSFVLTTTERAADLPHRPVYLTDWALRTSAKPRHPGTFGTLDEHRDGGAALCQRLWQSSGWRAADVDVVQLYDGFTPLIYLWMEALGMCGEGEAWRCLQDGLVNPSSGRPLLSGGGATGWGRMHGIPQVLECYLQLARRAGDRQMPATETGLACFALPRDVPATVLLFSTDPTA